MLSGLDLDRLDQALGLAEKAIGLSEPNPRVGCVIGLETGEVLGAGFTQAAGQAHAEVMALREAGRAARGATAWVTLEPCAHHGRTPPCADALVAAGIVRVVAAVIDPHPAVAGRGLERLRAAGLAVALADGAAVPAERERVDRARELNIGFFSRFERGRPWVRAKMAASIDGYTALPDGRSQWITGPAARADGHAWRARAGAVLTGIGTVLADDPRLDVRLHPVPVVPWRIVLDTQARMPTGARLLAPPGRVAIVVATDAAVPDGWLGRADGATSVLRVPRAGRGLDLGALLATLTQHQVNELHVEAGPTLTAALHGGGWIDEWLLYLAPRFLGRGRPLMSGLPAGGLHGHPEWRVHDQGRIGDDLRIRLRRSEETPGVGKLDTGLPADSRDSNASG
jgi:diaminohydroxyphosphoribosylaminopyrimidine deaminase/5-amino-6-(5-phosphoribosylamino)uracil reductase